MAGTAKQAGNPIALGQEEGEAMWFFGALELFGSAAK